MSHCMVRSADMSCALRLILVRTTNSSTPECESSYTMFSQRFPCHRCLFWGPSGTLKIVLQAGTPKVKMNSVWSNIDVSKNSGTPKSSILIGFSIINHPFWSTSIFGNPHIAVQQFHWRSFVEFRRWRLGWCGCLRERCPGSCECWQAIWQSDSCCLKTCQDVAWESPLPSQWQVSVRLILFPNWKTRWICWWTWSKSCHVFPCVVCFRLMHEANLSCHLKGFHRVHFRPVHFRSVVSDRSLNLNQPIQITNQNCWKTTNLKEATPWLPDLLTTSEVWTLLSLRIRSGQSRL